MTILNQESNYDNDDMSIDMSYVHDQDFFDGLGSTSDSSTATSQSSKSSLSSTTNSSLDSYRSFNIDLSQFDNLPDHFYSLGEVGSYAEIIGAFSLLLGCAMTDLDSVMDAIVNLSTINRREWNSVELTTSSPPKNRTINDLGPMCYHMTRFSLAELQTLNALFFDEYNSPNYVFCKNKFTFEETMIISLDYMANGTKFITMSMTYGGDWTRYSLMTNWFAKFIFHKYYHRLSGRSLSYFFEDSKVDIYREKIFMYIKHDQNGEIIPDLEHLNLTSFRPFGYLDCMQLAMCQPGSGPVNEDDDCNENCWRIQRAFFTKYGKMWGMKAQGVFLPNYILCNVFLTSVAQNNKGVIYISGLEEELERILTPQILPNGMLPAVYADNIYNYLTVICKSSRNRSVFGKKMSSGRVDIEHEFGLTASLFKQLQVKYTWKLLKMHGHVNEHLFSIFLW